MIHSELEMLLADVVRSKWGDKGIEYLVGSISSITTADQLTACNCPHRATFGLSIAGQMGPTLDVMAAVSAHLGAANNTLELEARFGE